MSGPPPAKPSASKKALAAPVVAIQEPVPLATALTHVRCPGGSGTVGTICAFGTATGDAPLIAVWGKVLDLLLVLPLTHPTDGSATQGELVYGDGWRFLGGTEVPVIAAACPSTPPAADNAKFAVWCVFDLGGGVVQEVPAATPFGGVCSTFSNCDGSGDGSVLDGGGGVTVETVPLQWQVTGKGFGGPAAAHFNTTWLLTLRSGRPGRACVWDNGGDGVRVPYVELCCDGVVATEWRLTLTYAGHRVFSTRPAREWDALGANRMTARAEAGDRDALRGTLTVTPV